MTFITNNWSEIILSIISIIVGAIVAYVFYRLQKRDVASAQIERFKRAREELLDFIESYIINKQNVSEESIYNLLAASEREYEVKLRDICTPIVLLQDVTLRLQKSRHLDITQKASYVTQIEQIISGITNLHKEIPTGAMRPLEMIEKAEIALNNNEKEKALEAISNLRQELSKPLEAPRVEDTSLLGRSQLIASIIAGIATVVATFTAISDYFALTTVDYRVIVAFVGILGSVVVLAFLIRFLKRSE